MQTVLYTTCEQLPCLGISQAPIVLCIAPAIALVSTQHTIPGTLVLGTQIVDDCNSIAYWNYTFAYDESLLTDPTTLLVSANILGVFCESCFTDWIKELIANSP